MFTGFPIAGSSSPRGLYSSLGGARNASSATLLVPVPLLLVLAALSSGFVVWVALDSHTFSDFGAFYDSALAVREGRNLYESAITKAGWHSMNPPHFILLMVPLTWVSIRSALIVWWLFTALTMVVCVRLWRRALPAGWALALFALLAASAAGYLNIRAANQTWLFAAVVTWAWMAWREKRHGHAAAVLGWAASVKLFLLIVLPYLIWRRKWNAVAWFLIAIVATVAAGVATFGFEAYVAWVRALSDQAWQGQALSMSSLGTITRLFDNLRSASAVDATWLIVPVWLAVTAGLLTILYLCLRCEDADRDFAALLITMLLITPSGWVYYVPLFAAPAAATVARSGGSWLWIAGVLLLLMPYPFVAIATGSSLLLVTVGSIYFWGGLALLAAVLKTAQLPLAPIALDPRVQ